MKLSHCILNISFQKCSLHFSKRFPSENFASAQLYMCRSIQFINYVIHTHTHTHTHLVYRIAAPSIRVDSTRKIIINIRRPFFYIREPCGVVFMHYIQSVTGFIATTNFQMNSKSFIGNDDPLIYDPLSILYTDRNTDKTLG